MSIRVALIGGISVLLISSSMILTLVGIRANLSAAAVDWRPTAEAG